MNDKCAYPECGNELSHVEGRRKKKYCSSSCRLRHWQQLNPVKKDKKYIRVPIEEWELLKQGVSQPIREVKNTPPNTITTPKEALVEVSLDELEIKKQISAIQAEKIPKERDTPNGRRVWQMEQNKKITELKNKLKL